MNRNIKLSGLGIEIYSKDLENIKWDLAVKKATKLGEGWRLPSSSEMWIIKDIRDIGVGNFPLIINEEDRYYWTSDEDSEGLIINGIYFYSCFFSISTGKIHKRGPKDQRIRVRYVRDIK